MYAFPRFVGEDLLDALAADPRWCPYLDLPLQHISDAMLRAMGRGMGRDDTLRLLDRLPERIPGLCMRTAYIVGHPGETDADFEELLAFVREGRFLHAGVFVYSHEEGTPSSALPGPVPPEVARRRRDELMRAQRGVSRAALQTWIGRTVEVIVDEPVARGASAPRHARWAGRHRGQAPEVDGVTFLAPRQGVALQPGRVLPARVVHGLDYDLVAEVSGAL
jgi:ribosomal protein S12 methylthiotransferase